MSELQQLEGEKAFSLFCLQRKLNKDEVLPIFEFSAFIGIRIRDMSYVMKNANSSTMPINPLVKKRFDMLNSEYGPTLLKAMILKQYASHRWPFLKIKKYIYFIIAFILSGYYEAVELFQRW
jgi:hypothetical protein